MKKTKMEKGITLIALIITIVVLLILAVVGINSITNDGVLSKATDAATKWNLAVNNEKERMSEYENFLNGLDSTEGGESSSGGSSGSTTPSTGTDVETIQFTIDGVTYSAEEGMKWQEWVNSSYNTGNYEITDNYIWKWKSSVGGIYYVVWNQSR